MTKAQEKQAEINNAIKHLKTMIRAGGTVYTSCDHVSRSGMTRHIKCFVSYKGDIINISYYVSVITGTNMNKHGALVVGGCGMDMGFHVVYDLSYNMYRKGYTRNGEKRKDGGYALNQRWM